MIRVVKKSLLLLITSSLFVLVMAACKSSGKPFIVIQSVTPTTKKIITITPAIHETITPSPKESGTQTPVFTPSATVPCFVTYQNPFAFIPGSQQMLVRTEKGVQVFDLQSMQQISFIDSPAPLNNPSVTLSPDGQTLVWAFDDGSIQAIRLSDQSSIFSINSGQVSPLKLEFTPLGDRLYSASHDGSIKLWDNQGQLDHILRPGGGLMNIGISPDGTMLATIPSDGPVTLWSIERFAILKELGGPGGYDTSDVAFSPDGQYLAADLVPGLFLWHITDGSELLGTSNPINSMAVTYSPDGKYLAYADLNKIVLSSPDGSQVIRTLAGHQYPIYELLFSPDASTIVSAAEDVRVWRVEDGQLLAIGKSACP